MPVYLFKKILLNDGQPTEALSPQEMVARLKSAMNTLKGDFFDPGAGRIAYERMPQSETYQAYLKLSHNLKTMELEKLARREERIAFWINLYNVIVIHGVIALGIRDSVKEVRNFFRRVYYQIGKYWFNPDDIEHGVLRGNRRPPYSLFRRFGAGDPRLPFIVAPLDPRIHFTLVCGASSCPFIDVYTPENLEWELTIAAQTFINSSNVVLNRSQGSLSLSRIFKWYAPDFGATPAARLRFIAQYLDNEQERGFIEDHAHRLKVAYQTYDWRLNRD